MKPQQSIPTKAKFIAQKCPVCNGFGTLKYGSLICHGCKGNGWVLVPAEIDRQKDIYESDK